jgi:hypothetical protein
MNWSEIINLILGGGLFTCLAGVLSLKSTVLKANAEAEKAKAEAETVRIDNAEHATRVLVENIVKPLKEELNATREDLAATKREMVSTKREMARFRKALDTANGCPHRDGCPVLRKLRDNQKDRERRGGGNIADSSGGQPTNAVESDNEAINPVERDKHTSARGQPTSTP